MSLPADIETQIQLFRVLVDQVSQVSGMSLLELALLAVPAMACALGDGDGCPCARNSILHALTEWANGLKTRLYRSEGSCPRAPINGATH
jgi:hypothetical protein